MQESAYRVSVTRRDGTQVHLRPGGVAEHDLATEVATEVYQRLPQLKIGFGVTQRTAEQRVKATLLELVPGAVEAVLLRIKSDIQPQQHKD